MPARRSRTPATLATFTLLTTPLAILLGACQPQPPSPATPAPAAPPPAAERPTEPPAGTLLQGLAEALIDTGFYGQVSVNGTIGQHYRPGTDSWKVLACFDFTAPDDEQGTNCIDSIEAFRLSNGSWIVGVTINEVYRWRALGLPAEALTGRPDAGPAAAPGSGAASSATQE